MSSTRKIDNLLSSVTLSDVTDETKKVNFDISGVSSATTRTLNIIDADTTLVGIDTTQTLTNKTINTTSNTLTIDATDVTSGTFSDARIAESNVTQHETAINHNNLLGFVSNEHIDWTLDQGATNINDANIASSAITQHVGSINHNLLLNYVANEHIDWTIDAGSNNINDANILASSITQHEGSINHDNLSGYVANEHIDWTVNNITNDINENNISQLSVTQHEGAINHDNLSGYVANEHIDWTQDQGATNINNGNITASSVTQHEGSINHDNLSGYVANEHIDWTVDNITNDIHQNNISQISVTQHEGAINHDNLSGFVANEHIDWTQDQGATNINDANITASSITQHEGSITIGNLSGAPTGTVVGTTDTQTLTNKTIGDNLNMNNNKITNLAEPTADNDAATKSYVDGVASGLDFKESVVAATTVDLNSNPSISGTISYNSTGGTSSRGQITATLTTTDTFTIDGITFSASDDGSRILIKDQSTAAQNGIWITTVNGTALTLDRATDFDDDNKVTSGAFIFIEQGTILSDSAFVLSTEDPITIGGTSGTALTFVQFSGAGGITAGTGLTKTGDTLNVGGSATIIANADSLSVNSSSTGNQVLLSSGTIGTASTFGSLPLDNSNAVSGILPVSKGGTGAITLTSNNFLQGNGTSAITATKTVPTGAVVGTSDSQTLTNKTINGSSNTLTNINATSLADGSVSNTEFQYINSLSSNVQTQIDNHVGDTNNPHSVTIDQITPTTTKGDLLVEDGTNVIRLGIGSDGSMLQADSNQTAGIRWVANPNFYDAIVATSGADFTTVAAAFGAGNQKVFVRNGTYTETSDIIIPEGGVLVGESKENTIITSDFNVITINGSNSSNEKAGTVSINKNSTTVTGTGTSFLNLNPVGTDTFIILDGVPYNVASVTNDTSLTLSITYQGNSLANEVYIAQKMKAGVKISNLTLNYVNNLGLELKGYMNCEFSKLIIDGNLLLFNIYECSNVLFDDIITQNTSWTDFDIGNSYLVTLSSVKSRNSDSGPIGIGGQSKYIYVSNCHFSGSGGTALSIAGTASHIQINNSVFSNHTAGISIWDTCSRIQVNNCIIRNNDQTGIILRGSNNSITNNIIESNGIAPVGSSTSGIFVNGTHNVINGNTIRNNSYSGIYLTNSVTDGVFTNNIINNNTEHGMQINGSNYNVFNSNNISSNTLNGLYLITANSNNVIGNNIASNGTHGIYLETNSIGNRLSNNQITNNTKGVLITSGSNNCCVNDNLIRDNSSHGIDLSSNKCTINNNRIYNNGGDGCLLNSGATDNTVIGNNFQDNTGTDFNDLGTISNLEGLLINSLDARSGTTLKLGESTATKVEIADTGVITEVQGNLDVLAGLDVTGDITVTGTVDGVDVAGHVAATSAHGVSGSIVGTSDSQTLTNKTINSSSNTVILSASTITSGTLPVARGGTGASTLTGWLLGNGTGAITAIRNNMAATAAPSGSTDDITLGYAVGSRWFDTTNDKEYVCLDATDGLAVWIETTNGVNASANIDTNAIVVGDDGVKGLRDTQWFIDGNDILGCNFSKTGFVSQIRNTQTSGGFGVEIRAGENPNEPTFRVRNQDGTLNLLDVDAGGYLIVGKTYAQTLTDNGVVYGIDLQSPTESDFNTQSGIYRIAGTNVVDVTQTLTNKTITATSNNVAARSLHSATTIVNVGSAAAPTSGQVLTATGSTAATWQTLVVGESNTSSSAGGLSLVLAKSGVNLPFKGLTASSNKILLTSNATNIGIDVTEANLNLVNIGGTLSIAKGGTGQTTKATAFNALSPNTTKGDITVHNGTNNIRVPVGTNNQVLIADSSQTAGVRWADAQTYFIVSSTTQTSTTSDIFTLINSMTTTPPSGTYIILFSASSSHTNSRSDAEYAIYIGGTVDAISNRLTGWNGGNQINNYEMTLHTQTIATVNGSQAVEVQWHNGGNGTFTVNERSLILLKVA